MSRIGITPIAGALGAEISGVDLSQPLEAGLVAELRKALLDPHERKRAERAREAANG